MQRFLNQVIHGDCLEIMPQIPMKSVDMILCDLPYGATKHDWDQVIPFAPLWREYERVIKDHGAIVLFANHPFGAALIMSNLKLFRYEWIWEKTQCNSHLNVHRGPFKRHESVMVFYKAVPTYHPQMERGEYPRSVLRFANPGKDRLHPTQKPVEICEYLIRTYTDEGSIVLDNCAGSGTTGEACINTGRQFICIEKQGIFAERSRLRLHGAQMPLAGSAHHVFSVGDDVMFRPPVGVKLRRGRVSDVSGQNCTVRGRRDNTGRTEEFTIPCSQVQLYTDYLRQPGDVLSKYHCRKRFGQHQWALEPE